MLFNDSLRKTKHTSINENYDLKDNLLRDKKINQDFLDKIKLLTLEEIICLKLDASLLSLKGKLYGFPILKLIQNIAKDAVLNYSLSVSKSKKEAAMILGTTKSHLNRLIKQYNIDIGDENDRKEDN